MFCSVHKHEANPASDKTSNCLMIILNSWNCGSTPEMSLGRGGTKQKYGRQKFLDSDGCKIADVVLGMHCDERLAGWCSTSRLRAGEKVASWVFQTQNGDNRSTTSLNSLISCTSNSRLALQYVPLLSTPTPFFFPKLRWNFHLGSLINVVFGFTHSSNRQVARNCS